MLKLIQDIEAKIKQVEENVKAHAVAASNLDTNLENLASDKKKVATALNIFDGALQAYKDVVASIHTLMGTNMNTLIKDAAEIGNAVMPGNPVSEVIEAVEAVVEVVSPEAEKEGE